MLVTSDWLLAAAGVHHPIRRQLAGGHRPKRLDWCSSELTSRPLRWAPVWALLYQELLLSPYYVADTGYMPGFLEIREHDTLFYPLGKWELRIGEGTLYPHRGPGRSQQEQGGDRQDRRNQSGPLLGSFCMSGTVLVVLFMYLTEIILPSPCPTTLQMKKMSHRKVKEYALVP